MPGLDNGESMSHARTRPEWLQALSEARSRMRAQGLGDIEVDADGNPSWTPIGDWDTGGHTYDAADLKIAMSLLDDLGHRPI